jgi:hypothetical protein
MIRRLVACLLAALVLATAAPAAAVTASGAGETQRVFWSARTSFHVCSPELTANHPWMITLRWRPYAYSGAVDYAIFYSARNTFLKGGQKRGHGTWNMFGSMLAPGHHYKICTTAVNPGITLDYDWYYA